MPISVPSPPVTGGGTGGGSTAGQWLRIRITAADGFDKEVSFATASVDIQRGKSSALDTTVPAGTCTVVFNDTDGTFDPDNTAGPLYGHLGTYNAQPRNKTGTVRIDHLITATGTYVHLFTGGIESLDRTFTGGDYSETTAVFVDSTAELNQHVPAVKTVLPMGLPGARIQALFGTASRSGFVWASRSEVGSYFDLDTGQKMLGTLTTDGTTTSWDMGSAAAFAESGLLFVNGAGVVVFQGQQTRLHSTPDWIMGDLPGMIPVETDLDFRYSTDNMLTDAAVATTDGITSTTGVGGTSQALTANVTGNVDLTDTSQLASWNAGAAKSVAYYQARSVPQRNAPTVTLNVAPVVGQAASTSGGTAIPPLTPPFTPSGGVGTVTGAYQCAVQIEISDLIQLTRTPSKGSPIVANYWVEGIHHSIVAYQSWTTSLTVSRADPVGSSYFTLGVSSLTSQIDHSLNDVLTW